MSLEIFTQIKNAEGAPQGNIKGETNSRTDLEPYALSKSDQNIPH